MIVSSGLDWMAGVLSHRPVLVRRCGDGPGSVDVTNVVPVTKAAKLRSEDGIVSDDDLLAGRFEENRPRLRAVAYRMLGSFTDADDAVQEAWLRLSRAGGSGVDNLGAWLTTVVGRVCLDMLRSRASRREEPLDVRRVESSPPGPADTDPEQETLLADSVGVALLVVLGTLAPVERLAFVLHDLFGVSFEEIAPIVGRSPAAARQLASRARRRVRGGTAIPGAAIPGAAIPGAAIPGAAPAAPPADRSRQREIVEAFLAAARGGEFATLLTLLDPDVVMRADAAGVRMGATGEVRGSAAVAGFFSGRAQGARPALLDGAVGAVVMAGGRARIALHLTITGGRITGIDTVAEPERLRELDVVVLDG
jgi:RNA polymerase sigma-70 factor (ECF subfamily)